MEEKVFEDGTLIFDYRRRSQSDQALRPHSERNGGHNVGGRSIFRRGGALASSLMVCGVACPTKGSSLMLVVKVRCPTVSTSKRKPK